MRLMDVAAIAVLTLGSALALGLGGCKGDEQGAALPKAPVPVTIAAETTSGGATADGQSQGEGAGVPEAILTGSTDAHRRSTISANQSGTVRGVHVREGDTVKAGQVIVSLDTTDFELYLRQANASIRAARVQVDTARIELDRSKKLLESKAIAARQNDAAVAQERGARAALQQAQVVRDMAQRSISEAEIRAPYDAIVVRRHISEGEAATAMPPTALITLEQRSPIDVRLDIPSARLRELSVGTPVRVRIPALGVELAATITRLVPSVDPRSRAALAIVEVPNEDGALAPGLFVEARLGAAPPTAAPTAKAAPVTAKPVAAGEPPLTAHEVAP